MNRNAHLKISEGIDKAASPCHNEKKKDMIPCRGIIPTSKDLEFRPTMHLVIHELEEKGVNHFSWGKGTVSSAQKLKGAFTQAYQALATHN